MALIIGTRGSKLALWQAHEVQRHLSSLTEENVEIKVISTRGDERLEIALHSHTLSKGLFTEELERELLSGEIDFAVHSLKDLPVEMPEGLCLGAVLERANPADVVLSNHSLESVQDLRGRHIGTSSPRRVEQLKALFGNDFSYAPVRGNVQTRIAKLRGGEFDAIIMAAAGIERLGLEEEIALYLPLSTMLPAPGQAAIGVQCAASNTKALQLAQQLNDPRSAFETWVERQLLLELGGGCSLPLGALCQKISDDVVSLSAFYRNEEGHTTAQVKRTLSVHHIQKELSTFASSLKKGSTEEI